IKREDEEKVRKAAKLINERVLQYKQRYADKEVQDFLAMTALQLVSQLVESEANQDISPLVENLKELNEELDEYLKEE
ncbi:MAG: cell division protein ZapA, partial [Bacteroidales bacterium]|nr:cell division protein ZapA [Bacteroidales bacterium]